MPRNEPHPFDTRLHVIVPKAGTALAQAIPQGTACVMLPSAMLHSGTAYYEGNIHGFENLRTFKERLQSAAGRLLYRYPTTARMTIDRADAVVVGVYTLKAHSLEIQNEAVLRQWLGEGPNAVPLSAA